ncbi:hypothetical protein SEA_GALADRIEL_77 [Gordonia phage Galadriel]|uniref:Membrane protein n=2 Tax=Vividuovirus TaxID=2560251 RepID=A0A7G8LE11_9CAUD|nr:hypothetical protein KNU61_gp77 [Gordonia phage Galadriel]YP_010109534.1 membrane protein [Gordonia phage Paries]QDH92096.1 hypothetical protein SEA_GALADRIEL_77 [Gordonia phage Galadriel]QNJ55483.1 membrane protein [Gordonia phage Paries]
MADVLVWCVVVGAALVVGWKASQSARTTPTAGVPARSTAWLDDDPFIGGDGRPWLPQPDGTWAPPP